MKAAVLTHTQFELQDIHQPTVGAHQILVRMMACGVCSGDLFVYKNRETLAASYSELGHEATGEVVAVGEGVTSFQVGDIVTALAQPAYRDYFVADEDMLVKLPSSIDPALALGEAIACCVHASWRFHVQKGARVAIIGCGFMGLICQQLAMYQGAEFVCGVDPIDDRRKMSQFYGAQAAYDPTKVSSDEILEAHGEFDVVIEAAGVQSAVDLATELVCQHGRIVLVGYHQSNDGLRTVNMQQWNFKAIDVVNGHVRRDEEKVAAMAEGMKLLAEGHLNTEAMVTRYPLSEIEAAFQALAGGSPGLFKAVLMADAT